jgi:hypothetical protein
MAEGLFEILLIFVSTRQIFLALDIMDKRDAPFLGSPFGEPSFGSLRVQFTLCSSNMCCKDLLVEMSPGEEGAFFFIHTFERQKLILSCSVPIASDKSVSRF